MLVVPFDRLVEDHARGSPCLVLGRGRGTVTDAFAARGVAVDAVDGDWPSIQLARRYEVAVVESAVTAGDPAVVHCAVQHLVPGGRLVMPLGRDDHLAPRFELSPVAEAFPDGVRVVVLERTRRRTIHDVVHEARCRLTRVGVEEVAARLRSATPPIVVDTRTATDRQRFGVIAGSIHVPRTVLEWHLDPANGYRHPAIESYDQPIVVVCNGGYSSSLAAASLLDLGFTDVGDLVGGVRAWTGAGHPVVAPDHTHLDL